MTSNALIGIAGVHYVAAELSRRGMVALPTTRNTAGYDIVVVTAEGTKHANIQVKASSKRVSFFPMPMPELIRAGPRDYYVLVRWFERENRFEGFMLTGRHAREAVASSIERQKRSIRRGTRRALFPSLHIDLNGNGERSAGAWRKTWETWKL